MLLLLLLLYVNPCFFVRKQKTVVETLVPATEQTQTNNHSLTHLPWIADRATIAVSEPTSLSRGLSALKPTTTIDSPCGVCALASS